MTIRFAYVEGEGRSRNVYGHFSLGKTQPSSYTEERTDQKNRAVPRVFAVAEGLSAESMDHVKASRWGSAESQHSLDPDYPAGVWSDYACEESEIEFPPDLNQFESCVQTVLRLHKKSRFTPIGNRPWVCRYSISS